MRGAGPEHMTFPKTKSQGKTDKCPTAVSSGQKSQKSLTLEVFLGFVLDLSYSIFPKTGFGLWSFQFLQGFRNSGFVFSFES